MELQVKGKNLEVSDSIRTYAERKLAKHRFQSFWIVTQTPGQIGVDVTGRDRIHSDAM